MGTLPDSAMKFGMRVDRLREMIRHDPVLVKLGRVYGGTRVYSEADAKQIKTAYDALTDRRRKAVAGTVGA